ncbi:ligand-binding sensor domain-containing protein [Xanthocytophaga agilis]|uniref:Two-component regulator propeller domain-containing protein n=1 Tax=Xanthocytophaga agilis TaxID=3048010 RepID=A0AAE3UIP7_9BACT|nr:two-component regulator propeller domain-containing protein [Xanthocytophaga agilis]MDJ1505651.1 two-component regulator propeller domain-containing protein [Xanthocytophaga agilis]
MKKYFSKLQAFTFLTILLMSNHCLGQAQANMPKKKESESNTLSVNSQKFIKTQSLNKGDNVHCSLQDKAGNLWFGTTADGIYKYDGNFFTHFTMANGLNSNTVWCMLKDKSDKIWIGTSDGICLYNNNKFTKIQIALPTDMLSSKYDVWSIMQDKSGKLWFATGAGVYVYDGKSFVSFTVTEDVKDCSFKIEKILEDKAGNFWFGGRCNPGVYCYDGKTITHLKPNGDDWVWPVLQDKKGNIWFSSWKGAYRYDGKSFRIFTKNDGLADNVVTRIMEDKKGNLWFGGGLSRYDGKSFTRFTTEDGITNSGIWTILEDNSGNFWIGTNETGLYRYDGKTFTKFSK